MRKASPATFSVNNDELLNTETAIVVASSSPTTAVVAAASPFMVPEHWIVEKRRRTNGVTAGLVDKYYYEPETGRKFRSLRSIEEYLQGSERKPSAVKLLGYEKKEEFPKKRKNPTVKSYDSPRSRYISSKFPEGWIVEECLRLSGVSAGKVDRFYIEPETGQKFRSLKSVQEFLAESQNNTPALELSSADLRELFEKRDMATGAQSSRTTRRGLCFHSTPKQVPFSDPCYDDIIFKSSQRSDPFKNQVWEGMPSSSSNEATVKVKWVFSGSSGEDRWSPYVGESLVPEPVQ